MRLWRMVLPRRANDALTGGAAFRRSLESLGPSRSLYVDHRLSGRARVARARRPSRSTNGGSPKGPLPGIAKNANRLLVASVLANLFNVRRRLLMAEA